jgi:hypothetical protein
MFKWFWLLLFLIVTAIKPAFDMGPGVMVLGLLHQIIILMHLLVVIASPSRRKG